jgi:hypothetical protein
MGEINDLQMKMTGGGAGKDQQRLDLKFCCEQLE